MKIKLLSKKKTTVFTIKKKAIYQRSLGY